MVSEMPDIVAQLQARKLQAAAARGLTAKWSKHFGYVSLHDPTTGEVHDVSTKDAPKWVLWEVSTRKRLWKSGRRDAFDLTSAQIQELWEAEHPVLEEGIIEEHTEDLG
jgi:hypothetical protein